MQIRLIYASGVREANLVDTTGSAPLSPLGTAADANRANAMFTVAPDVTLLGIADADGDNNAELCIIVTDGVPEQLFVTMNCEGEDDVPVLSPMGTPCTAQMVTIDSESDANVPSTGTATSAREMPASSAVRLINLGLLGLFSGCLIQFIVYY